MIAPADAGALFFSLYERFRPSLESQALERPLERGEIAPYRRVLRMRADVGRDADCSYPLYFGGGLT